jgi:hypothetical protein
MSGVGIVLVTFDAFHLPLYHQACACCCVLQANAAYGECADEVVVRVSEALKATF